MLQNNGSQLKLHPGFAVHQWPFFFSFFLIFWPHNEHKNDTGAANENGAVNQARYSPCLYNTGTWAWAWARFCLQSHLCTCGLSGAHVQVCAGSCKQSHACDGTNTGSSRAHTGMHRCVHTSKRSLLQLQEKALSAPCANYACNSSLCNTPSLQGMQRRMANRAEIPTDGATPPWGAQPAQGEGAALHTSLLPCIS